jgi:hypothetical protein
MKEPIKKILLPAILILISFSTVADYTVKLKIHNIGNKTVLKEAIKADIFDETGTIGNIALIGTNGITGEDISSNHDYYYEENGDDTHYMNLFDGYQGGHRMNADAGDKIGGGVYKMYNRDGLQELWISVDLKKVASISGFRLLNRSVNGAGYMPKNIIVQSSLNGVNFTNDESFLIENVRDTGFINIEKDFLTRHLRFTIIDNYNDEKRIMFGGIEIFQN